VSQPIEPPIVVVRGADCEFHRTMPDAHRATAAEHVRLYDARGSRVIDEDGEWRAVRATGGPDELAGLLRAWLNEMDALRESTANWPLALLVEASVEHLGYR
jgi:hypothetical protein